MNVAVRFLISSSIGNITYSPGESAGFPYEIAAKLVTPQPVSIIGVMATGQTGIRAPRATWTDYPNHPLINAALTMPDVKGQAQPLLDLWRGILEAKAHFKALQDALGEMPGEEWKGTQRLQTPEARLKVEEDLETTKRQIDSLHKQGQVQMEALQASIGEGLRVEAQAIIAKDVVPVLDQVAGFLGKAKGAFVEGLMEPQAKLADVKAIAQFANAVPLITTAEVEGLARYGLGGIPADFESGIAALAGYNPPEKVKAR